MYQDAHNEKSGRHGIRMNRTAVLLIAIILLISTAVGSTVAFLATKTEPVENSFEYANVSCKVMQDPDTDGSIVQVKNTGTISAYIRAAVVANWMDIDGNIAASDPEGYSYKLTCSSGSWVQGTDGFFYYLLPVAPGASTEGNLLTCTVVCPKDPEYTLSVEVLAEAIQSTPANAVNEAWSAAVDGDGKLSVN